MSKTTPAPQSPALAGRRLLTLESVAERWDCSRRYLEGLIKDGILPAIKMGKRMTRLREADIEAYENRFLMRGPQAITGANA